MALAVLNMACVHFVVVVSVVGGAWRGNYDMCPNTIRERVRVNMSLFASVSIREHVCAHVRV